REEEERVHPPVHAVEEQHPAPRGERRGGKSRGSPGQTRADQPDERHARDREERREEPQRTEPTAEVDDDEREQEVERRATAPAEHDLEEVGERVAPDEERERLVLVRRPREEPREHERRDG